MVRKSGNRFSEKIMLKLKSMIRVDPGGSCSTKKLAILRRIGMNGFSGILAATGLALGLALAGAPAMAQQPKQAAPAAPPLKQASPAALAAAREILVMKNASAMYANAVPNIADKTKNALVQQNLNY